MKCGYIIKIIQSTSLISQLCSKILLKLNNNKKKTMTNKASN